MTLRKGDVIRWLACGVMGVMIAILPVWAGDLESRLAALRSPESLRAVSVREPVSVGKGTLVPGDGVHATVLTVNGDPIGVHLSGPMTWRYRVANRFSIPVAKRNLDGVSLPFTMDEDVVVLSVPVTDVVIWSSEAAMTFLPSDRLSVPFRYPKRLAAILKNPLFRRPCVDRLAVAVPGDSGRLNAVLAGKKWAFWLRSDATVTRKETLFLLKAVASRDPVDRGRWYRAELATQPLGRRWQDPVTPPVSTLHTTLTVTNDRDEHVVIQSVETIRANRNGVSRWVAPLRQRVFKGDDVRYIRVTSVRVNGEPADFLFADNRLVVALPSPLAKNQQATVAVDTEGDIAIHPGGDNYWSLGTWAWYPQVPLGAEHATFEITVRCPRDFSPFASGTIVSKGTENNLNVLKTRIDKPMQFPVVAAGHYHVYDGTHGELSCSVASYATGKKKHAKRLQNNFFAAATYYQSLFDLPYPFPHQNVIEVNSWGFGQAPPGIIFITQEAFSPLQDTLTRIFSGGVNERFVHEIAHAYWGHVLKMPNLEEQWLSESFAEYSAAMCIQAMNRNRKKGRIAFEKILKQWTGGVKTMGEGGSVYLANHFSGERDTDYMDRIHLLYHKGPLVVHAIRLSLQKQFGEEKGDKAFIILLRAFLKNFPYKYGATHHLMGILNQLTKKDWSPWFDRYVFGTEMPPVT